MLAMRTDATLLKLRSKESFLEFAAVLFQFHAYDLIDLTAFSQRGYGLLGTLRRDAQFHER